MITRQNQAEKEFLDPEIENSDKEWKRKPLKTMEKKMGKRGGKGKMGINEGEKNLFYDIQNILIIGKGNSTPINLLSLVFFLFHFQNVLQGKNNTNNK